MDRLFNMDNKFFTVMGRVADLIMLNVVFLMSANRDYWCVTDCTPLCHTENGT